MCGGAAVGPATDVARSCGAARFDPTRRMAEPRRSRGWRGGSATRRRAQRAAGSAVTGPGFRRSITPSTPA
jgi:hypothetical protein